MRTTRLITFGVALLCGYTVASAESGWTDYAAVAEVQPTGFHYYLVRLPVKKNPSECKDKEWFFQDYGGPGAKEMYATLLESLKSGLRVRVYVTGRCNLDGYAEISSLSAIR
jgi:hypothetical protein